MEGIRHEKYGNLMNGLPFSLGINIKRNRYNLNKEQNWHENIEIQLCTSGQGTVLLDGKQYIVEKDDILVVNSNVIHYTFTENQLAYTCLIISTDWCKQMNINYDKLHFTPFLRSSILKNLLCRLSKIYVDTKTPLRLAKLNKILLDIFIELIENHSVENLEATPKNNRFDMVKSAITYIQNNYKQKITLPDIASAVLFDKYSLCKEFKKYTGQTIFEYLNQYRSTKAIEHLSKGHTVYETALLCGFENLSYFIKTFKKYTGKTPAKYKIKN